MIYMILPKPLEKLKDTFDSFNLDYDVFEGIEPINISGLVGTKNENKFDLYTSLYFCSICYKGPFYVYLIYDKFYYKYFEMGRQHFLRIHRHSVLRAIQDLQLQKLPYEHLLVPKEKRILNGDFELLEKNVDSYFDNNTVKRAIKGFCIDKDLVAFSDKECEKLEILFKNRR